MPSTDSHVDVMRELVPTGLVMLPGALVGGEECRRQERSTDLHWQYCWRGSGTGWRAGLEDRWDEWSTLRILI